MADGEEIRSQKQLCNRAVLLGASLMAAGLLASAWDLTPEFLATAAAVVGFCFLAYGVHVGWQIFYDRESDGPAS